MTVRDIRLIGDPDLRTPTRTVTDFDAGLARLVDDLLDTVQEPGRAGVAATQIGVDLAVFSFNLHGRLGYVVNPDLVVTEGDYDGPEGCLSVPGVQADVLRPQRAVVQGFDREGNPVTVEGEGEFARCLQHEVEHLQGRLFLDRLTGERKRSAMRQLRSVTGPA